MARPTLIALVLLAVAVCPVPCSAEVQDLLIDPLDSTAHWQIGGQRINYTLGSSSLAASVDPDGADAKCLKLTYDFGDGRRWFISAYHTGAPIPGRCEELSFRLYGDGSGRPVRLAIEDARGRWFERDGGAVDWTGWERVAVPVGDGQDWLPLLRRGEARLPILHPVNLRQVGIYRRDEADPTGAIHLQELRARTDVVGADFVTARVTTGRRANLFYVGDTVSVDVEFTNTGRAPVSGRLRVAATDFFGTSIEADLGTVSLSPGATERRAFSCEADRLGAYAFKATLDADGRERTWFGRYAVSKPAPVRPPDPDALFGCCVDLAMFSSEDLPLVLELVRGAGIRSARIGFHWPLLNPAPGVWAWEPPERIDGMVGKALKLTGQGVRVPHSPALDCRDEVTVAFWARSGGANGRWQAVLQKWGHQARRNYGVYFGRDTGEFCFSASYTGAPAGTHADVNSGFSAWDGRWHHYAATYSRADKQVVLYVDGRVEVSQEQDGGELRTNSDDLVIGQDCPADVDELVVYRRALRADEVAALAQKSQPPPEGLVAWWQFEGEGTTIEDRSGNGFHATAEGLSARAVRLGLENGITTLGILGFPPSWASTAPAGSARPHVYKPDMEAWTAFVEGVTRRHKDTVQHWEIWNEPNIDVFWAPEPDPDEFLDVVVSGYAAAKRGNPSSTVITPGLAGPGEGRWGMDFIERLIGLGVAQHCDAISIHPYRHSTPEGSDLTGDLRHIDRLARESGTPRRLWFTENCWTTQLQGGSSEHRQAQMLPRCYVLSLATGLMDRLMWFRFWDPGVDPFYLEHNCGLLANDLTPKPVYFAHRTVAEVLDRTTPERQWNVGPDAMAFSFVRPATADAPSERVAAVWSPEGRTPLFIRTGTPGARVIDLMGNETTVLTEDGLLYLEASETAVFLRGLTPEAGGVGPLVEVSGGELVRGEAGELVVRVANASGAARSAKVSVEADPPLTVAVATAEGVVAAGGSASFAFAISADGVRETGVYAAGLTWESMGRAAHWDVPIAVRSVAADAGPVGKWDMDEGDGTAIGDSSGSGNHGTIEGPTWVPGKRGSALSFDGGSVAEVPHAESLSLRDEVTVAFWFRLAGDTGTWQMPVVKFGPTVAERNYGVYLSLEDQYPCFSASFERGSFHHTDTTTQADIRDGQWHHVAATFSVFDRAVRLYVDGDLAGEKRLDEGAMKVNAAPLRIGADTAGAIDELVIYPRALSPDEVAELAR